MRVGEFLKQICDAQGPSQEQAVNVIEGLSPVGFAGLVTELGKQMAAADAVRPERVHRAKRQGGADGMGRMKQPGDRQHAGRDRHPVTMEALDWEWDVFIEKRGGPWHDAKMQHARVWQLGERAHVIWN